VWIATKGKEGWSERGDRLDQFQLEIYNYLPQKYEALDKQISEMKQMIQTAEKAIFPHWKSVAVLTKKIVASTQVFSPR
jgi:hypothetical protein